MFAMKFGGTFLNHVVLGIVTLMTLNSDLAVAEQLDCNPPPGTVRWDPQSFHRDVTVVWGYGLNLTCHSVGTCNGSELESDDMHWEHEEAMPLQLRPVELQMGNRLWFEPSHHMGIPFPLELYKVDEEGFYTCDVTRGQFVEMVSPTNESFEVPQSLLAVGNNYFITDPEVHPLVNCHMGERINVTVKSNLCDHQTHGSMCSGWGLCVTHRGDPSFRCSCCGNYRGERCEIFDSCLSNPCQNGGACVHSSDNFHRYSCNCPLGYFGTFCEQQTSNMCQLVMCENNSTCIGNSTHFRCECPAGLTGTHCEVDVNECQSASCGHGVCVDRRNGYTCYCEPGYQGPDCTEQLHACSLNPCRNGGFCEDVEHADLLERAYQCHCKPGWKGNTCTVRNLACEPNPCSPQGKCEEYNGTFLCHCSPGFTGVRCEVNINDCVPNPCRFGGHCRDGIHAHTCLCIHSHAGSNCQYTLDMFSPVLDEVDAEGHVIHNPAHMRNLYIVASCLTGLVLTMMAVLLGCYCRVGEICRRWNSCCGFSRFWYKKQFDDMVVSVDVTSASDCPLAVDAFWSSPDPDQSSLAGHATRSAFGNQTV